jgi:hypothetical protein
VGERCNEIFQKEKAQKEREESNEEGVLMSVIPFKTPGDKELDGLLDLLRKESFVAVSIDEDGQVNFITNRVTHIKAVGLLEVAKAAILDILRDEDMDWGDDE